MDFPLRRIVLVVFAVVVVDIAHAHVQPSDRTATIASGVRVDKSELVLEPRLGGRMYYVAGTLQSPGAPASTIAAQRAAIPRSQIEDLIVYELIPIVRCQKGNCNPCKPDKTCLNPPKPPPPPIARTGNSLRGFVLPAVEPAKRQP